MRIRKWMGVMALLLFAVAGLQAQDFALDMQKMQKVYASENLYLEMTAKGEEKKGEAWIPAGEKKIRVQRKGKEVYYTVDSLEVIVTKSLSITIDHDLKMVFLEKRKAQAKDPAETLSADTEFSDSLKTEFLGEKEGVKGYRVFSPGQEVSETEIYLFSLSGKPQRMVYTYNPEMYEQPIRSEIVFTAVETAVKLDSCFEEKKYVLKKGDRFELSGSLHNYELIIPDDAN